MPYAAVTDPVPFARLSVVTLVTGSLVNIGGRSIRVASAGTGHPSVILEAGSGCWSTHWRTVQERVAEFTTVYSYDRAGHGDSGAAGDGSLSGWLADLEAWVEVAGVRPPVVLVGHSLGGHIVRAYAAAHPGEVAGMVLVDARQEDLYPQLPAAFLTRLAEAHPRETAQATRGDEIIRGGPGLGDVPLSVITHGRFDWLPDDWGLTDVECARAEAAWQEAQRWLARTSTRSRLVVAADAGHMIAADRPDVIIEEIRWVIDSLS